jgi:hypothetical protein
MERLIAYANIRKGIAEPTIPVHRNLERYVSIFSLEKIIDPFPETTPIIREKHPPRESTTDIKGS